MTPSSSSDLPEGFFDDPDQDARARGVSRTQHLDAEYEAFKKIIQSEEVKSDLIVEKDDAMRDVDRDLIEVDELITRWTRIEQLHQKREELRKASAVAAEKQDEQRKSGQESNFDNKQTKLKKKKSKKQGEESDDDSDDADDIDLENVMGLSLRSKNIC